MCDTRYGLKYPKVTSEVSNEGLGTHGPVFVADYSLRNISSRKNRMFFKYF